MSERLTWEEIVERYPDEWVVLDDVEDDDYVNVISAVLVAHSKDHERAWADFEQVVPGNKGLLFTGEELPVDPDVVYIL